MNNEKPTLDQILRNSAKENGLPLKVVEKWHMTMDVINRSLGKILGKDLKQNGVILKYKGFEIFAEVVDKGRVEVTVRVGHVTRLVVMVQNKQPEHLADICEMVLKVMNITPKSQGIVMN